MIDAVVESLISDLLHWLTERDRNYEETMEAWRTSCPRLPVWEDANDRGFIQREKVDGNWIVKITPAGLEFIGQASS